MTSEDSTHVENYPELETSVEDDFVAEDEKPITTTSHDWTVGVLNQWYRRDKIDLQPKFQREFVWSSKPELRSRLIESFLLDIPIPPVYFAEASNRQLEVIDGQQRLTTLLKFLNNEFSLEKLQRLGSLNGKYFKDLSVEQQDTIEMSAQIRSILINTGARPELRYEVFERLNRGSVALNEQEMRNSVYRGNFNDKLADLEQDYYWRKVKGADEPEPRFKEREIILRFFAFVDRIDNFRGNLKQFLNEYMGKYAPNDKASLEEHADTFRKTMRNVYTVFGASSARLYYSDVNYQGIVDGGWDHKFSVSALDIQASALNGRDSGAVEKAAEQLREAYLLYLLSNPSVRDAISGQTASVKKTKTRWYGYKSIVQEILYGLKEEPRFFSYDFRRRLFEKEATCKLCGNEIHTFEDCTVDHIVPYSKDGRTVPDNAQLAHRICNARKHAKVDDENESDSGV